MSVTYPVPVNLHSKAEAEAYRRHIRQARRQQAATSDEPARRVEPVEAARSADHALIA